jgi:hypothetical protein
VRGRRALHHRDVFPEGKAIVYLAWGGGAGSSHMRGNLIFSLKATGGIKKSENNNTNAKGMKTTRAK